MEVLNCQVENIKSIGCLFFSITDSSGSYNHCTPSSLVTYELEVWGLYSRWILWHWAQHLCNLVGGSFPQCSPSFEKRSYYYFFDTQWGLQLSVSVRTIIQNTEGNAWHGKLSQLPRTTEVMGLGGKSTTATLQISIIPKDISIFNTEVSCPSSYGFIWTD